MNSLSGLRSANPLPSKKFLVEEVIKILTKKLSRAGKTGTPLQVNYLFTI